MNPARRLLPPSSSLPPLRSLSDQPETCVLSALNGLHALYCPLPTPIAFQTSSAAPRDLSAAADSGYASDNDDEACGDGEENDGLELRDDPYERAFAERWLTGFLGRAEELACFEDEDARQYAIDRASSVLASFVSYDEGGDVDDADADITRDYRFTLNLPDSREPGGRGRSANSETVTVQLTDSLAGRDNTDHTDVGLQSWGAAFIFTELMCAAPSRLNLTRDALGAAPRIIELGAGTGLVGIALHKILPRLNVPAPMIIATDFHPAVLRNLQANIVKNVPTMSAQYETNSAVSSSSPSIQAAPLNWETPDLSPPLHQQAEMLVATDVIYDPEHAAWLRDCAARMLRPDGVFWLMLTVRTTGKFEGIGATVRAAFNGRDGLRNALGHVLAILDEERFPRPSGIGRGDESEYRLFRIGWAWPA